MTTTGQEKASMYERIARHGSDLLTVFPNASQRDPVKLCKALRRIETSAHRDAERYCNGQIESDSWEVFATLHMGRVCKILGIDPAGSVPLFVNGDARGYALKLCSEWTKRHAPGLHRDWGGYGIIAPDLSEEN